MIDVTVFTRNGRAMTIRVHAPNRERAEKLATLAGYKLKEQRK